MMQMNYDKDFLSAYEELEKFEKEKGNKDLNITIKQNEDICYTYKTKMTSDIEESFFYVKKIILSLIYMVGGNEIIVNDLDIYNKLITVVDDDKELSSAIKNMEVVFHKDFEITYYAEEIKEKEHIVPLSDDFSGNRIGFDAGGSDRKVSAVKDGKVIFSEETLWLPKEQEDYHYHYDGILDSMKKAYDALGGKVDAIGVSSAGIVMNDEMAQSNLFIKVPEKDQIKFVRSIYKDIAKKEFHDVPLKVANDGDVTALGGELMYHKDHILGLAMGTSEATGYCQNKSFNGWINELGKVPMNYAPDAVSHYATGIVGAGSEYLSQKGIIRLCGMAGIVFEGTLAKQLVQIQEEAKKGNPVVLSCYEDMGIYLGSSLALYKKFLDIRNVLLLGRVMTGVGGDIIINKANEYLKEKHIDINVFTADENFKRLGQSFVAAGLVKLQ